MPTSECKYPGGRVASSALHPPPPGHHGVMGGRTFDAASNRRAQTSACKARMIRMGMWHTQVCRCGGGTPCGACCGCTGPWSLSCMCSDATCIPPAMHTAAVNHRHLATAACVVTCTTCTLACVSCVSPSCVRSGGRHHAPCAGLCGCPPSWCPNERCLCSFQTDPPCAWRELRASSPCF